jgi:hypothetical protein
LGALFLTAQADDGSPHYSVMVLQGERVRVVASRRNSAVEPSISVKRNVKVSMMECYETIMKRVCSIESVDYFGESFRRRTYESPGLS